MAERRFTDVEIERVLAGDSPERARAFAAEATEADRTRRAELEADNAALFDRLDVDAEVAAIAAALGEPAPARAPRRRVPWWRRPAVIAGYIGAAAAAAALALFALPGKDGAHPDIPDISVKGDIALVVHAATAGGSRKLRDGDRVTPGDRLRFEVSGAEPGFVAIIGIDGAGTATVYYPYGADAPAAWTPGAGPLPGAIALDAVGGDERIVAVFGKAPFSLAAARDAVAAGAPLPAGVAAAEITLTKKISDAP